MTIYRENVLDIIDNWEGYRLQDPCGDAPAINAGSIEMKCFVNNICPFYAAGYKEDALVFNEETYRRIQPWLPDTLAGALTVTKGAPGIHFRPRVVFRNNYIYHKYSSGTGEIDTSAIDPIDDLYDNFESNYRDVSQIDPSSSKVVPGSDETRYKAEQSWVVVKSIFDTPCTYSGVEECDSQAEWGYKSQRVSDSEVKDEDLKYDYNLKYYTAYKNSWEKNAEGSYKLKPNERLRINKTRVQMPVQKRVLTDENGGVHWRLMKRTPLFKGEDFFIRFHKQATDTIVNPNDTDSAEGIAPFPKEFSQYFPLDVTRDDLLDMDSRYSMFDSLKRKMNFAISPPTIGNEKPNHKKFDFHDQAYYIIELGVGTYDERYFIIIAERANPIFVNFVPVAGDKTGSISEVSKKLSEFEEISGSQLIHAPSFDISVRNHLGTIVIQFSGEGINVPPWIVKRWDWSTDKDPVSGDLYLKDKVRRLEVPRGRMTIMGGNIRSGFLFGPLQYSTQYITMIYPPKEAVAEQDDMSLAFTYGEPEMISARSMSGAFNSSPFFLPSQGHHSLEFNSTDIFLEDIYKHVVPVGTSAVGQSLFMQDAQFYSNYPNRKGSLAYSYGGYLYDDTLRDFSEHSLSSHSAPRTSNIVVRKYRYLDDPKTRQQAFDVLIGMMCGDHVFTYGSWAIESPTPSRVNYRTSEANYTDINDNMWYLRSCKTPIVTSLRLVSHESDSTRWADGTSVGTGTNFTPLEGESPYFIDVTDHLMSYSDSWSASGFSEMEHSGSLNFYLNRGMPVDNNVTDALMSLQNKTFYVEIWAGYSRGCSDYSEHPSYPSYSRQNGLFKLFTGLCHGGSISYEYGKTIMSCKIEDYTAVLKGTRFFNSPWFDGVKDINCIREILQMASFRDVGKYDPGSLIRFLSDNVKNRGSGVFFHHFDGRLFKMEPYALPSGYNRLEQAAFKFNDGDPYMDAIVKIAKRAGKVFFFDQHGIAHYENFQDIIQSDYLGKVPIKPLYYFTTNPELYPGQLIFNKLERNYDVSGIANHIKIMSNTPDFYLLIGDDLNWSSMENPDSEGFIGYLKSIYQQEGMFGSKEAMMDTIRKYSVSFRPKIKSKFETYGVPLRANDIIQVNGETTRVMKVSHNITAEKNEWWMEVETEKYQIINASRSVG